MERERADFSPSGIQTKQIGTLYTVVSQLSNEADAVIEEIRKRTRDLLSSPQVLAMPALSPAEEAEPIAKVGTLLAGYGTRL